MTIEAKLDESNKLLAGILAQLTANAEHAGRPVASAAPAKPAAKAVTPKATPPAAPAATPPANPAPLTYEKDVKAPMMELAKLKGRGAVEAIFNATFKGIKKATELKPTQWPEFIAAVAAAKADESIPLVVVDAAPQAAE